MKHIILFVFIAITTAVWANEPNKPGELTDAQRWALGVSGPLAGHNHMKFDTLAGREIDQKLIKNSKDTLKEWWGIESREDLLEDLEWLEDGGHSASFQELADTLFAPEMIGPTISRAEFEEELKTNPKLKCKVEIVTKYYDLLGEKSLYGWDTVRYVLLCRFGFVCGYITEEEAWEYIMPAAIFAQQTFDSWQDLALNYLIGRRFWSPFDEKHYNFEDVCTQLLEMPDSPWALPWDLPLEENEDQGATTSAGVLAMDFTQK